MGHLLVRSFLHSLPRLWESKWLNRSVLGCSQPYENIWMSQHQAVLNQSALRCRRGDEKEKRQEVRVFHNAFSLVMRTSVWRLNQRWEVIHLAPTSRRPPVGDNDLVISSVTVRRRCGLLRGCGCCGRFLWQIYVAWFCQTNRFRSHVCQSVASLDVHFYSYFFNSYKQIFR